jgi:general secretion pathway protein L
MKIALTTAVALARQFIRWWLAELAGLVPKSLRRLRGGGDRLILSLEGRSASLCRESADGIATLTRIADTGDPAGRELIQSMLRQRGVARTLARRQGGIALRLPASRALRCAVDLPAAAEANLAEVIAFELDRHTPFRADQAYFAFRRVAQGDSAGQLRVEIAAVSRGAVEEALDVAAVLGLDANRVDVAGAQANAAPSDALLIGDRLPTPDRPSHRFTYGLAATAVVLAMLAAAIPIQNAQHRASQLASEFDAVKKTTVAAAGLRDEIDALRRDDSFLIERRRQSPTISRLLFEATHALPDDTWLNEFQIVGPEAQLVGFAASASALVGILERSRIFRDTSFRSPVTQDPQSGRERFSIAARILSEGQP